MVITFDIVNGLCLGLEHISGDEEDDISYMIVVNALLFRICLIKYK